MTLQHWHVGTKTGACQFTATKKRRDNRRGGRRRRDARRGMKRTREGRSLFGYHLLQMSNITAPWLSFVTNLKFKIYIYFFRWSYVCSSVIVCMCSPLCVMSLYVFPAVCCISCTVEQLSVFCPKNLSCIFNISEESYDEAVKSE